VLVELVEKPADVIGPGTAISIVAGALKDAMSVNPWIAALWLAGAVALAALVVYTWRRLARL
jgi:hypothetical protein